MMIEKKNNIDIEPTESNRSHQPKSKAFTDFMGSNWGARAFPKPNISGAKPFLAARHKKLGNTFLGDRLIIPAGNLQIRNNDNDYRFRPHSNFAYLTGLGGEMEPDAVLVLHPTNSPQEPDRTHRAVLYFTPRAPRSSKEFYADTRHGEFWVGARPSLEEMETITGIETAHINNLPNAIADNTDSVQLRIVPQVDMAIQKMVDQVRHQSNTSFEADKLDAELCETLSKFRLLKDKFEVDQLQKAVDATKEGFEAIIRSLPNTVGHPRGERVIETTFYAVARQVGNGLGYETIAAAGDNANTLHWKDNDGTVERGCLVLVDAGVEVDSLYTGDITRTFPVDGKFTEVQAKIYEAVLDAAEAAFERAKEKCVRFSDLHQVTQKVLASHLEDWGLLPVSAEESVKPTGQQHRRWMPHGTCHHLGLDVHDCSQVDRETYQNSFLEPGMVFTIEPGLYFRSDDMSVPPEFRGTGVRIEDNIVIETNGKPRRLSQDIPRTIEGVEHWITQVQNK